MSYKKVAVVMSIITIIAIASNAKYIFNAPSLLTGFSAKVGCSLRHITKLDEDQVREDLIAYSSLIKYVSMDFQDTAVTSSILWSKDTAIYRKGYGCVLGSNSSMAKPINGKHIAASETRYPQIKEVNQALASLIQKDRNAGYDTRALLVMKGGKVIAEQYESQFTAETMFMGWSMAKTLNAIIVGNLIDNDRLDRQKAPLFSSWQTDDRRNITLDHLLTMTSGLDFEENYNPGGDAVKMLFSDNSVYERPMASALITQPGEHFSYSSGSANLLSYLAFSSFDSHDKALQYLQENILGPLGMNNTVLELDPSGLFVGSSFIYATAENYAKLGQLFLDQGVSSNGTKIVSPEWIQSSTSPNASSNEDRYGYQVWLNTGKSNTPRWPDLPQKAFAAKGNKGQYILVIPEQELVIVRLGWSKAEYPINSLIRDILMTVK